MFVDHTNYTINSGISGPLHLTIWNKCESMASHKTHASSHHLKYVLKSIKYNHSKHLLS